MRITPVVHIVTARQTVRASEGRRRAALPDQELRPEPPVPLRYVLVPDPLITAYAHDPLAVGVYVAIARLAVIAKAAVPLAARDLAAWMGSHRDADRAAIMRRIVKLEEGGWVIIERTAAAKHHLLPTWGRDQAGTARPWRFDTADSGRPSHLRGRRVPLALFDDYLGRLDPQPGQYAAPTLAELDPASDALLRAMGVRERQKLADVPHDLIAAWQTALEHPGLAAQFTSPIGFAVNQMQRGNAPPLIVELDRWAERARRNDDRYESWRYIETPTIAGAAITYEQQLDARVRAIASPDVDLGELCALACYMESGATDAEAVAHLRATRVGAWDEPGRQRAYPA
jgi:hypothetical protein